MHLSTSNSRARLTKAPWKRLWLQTLIFSFAMLIGIEFLVRHSGNRPSVVDDTLLWASQRDNVYDNGDAKDVLVFIGSSHSQLAIDPDVFESRFPKYRVVQLAISGGTKPTAVFADLANDERFHGTLICDVFPTGAYYPEEISEQQAYVDFYNNTFRQGLIWNELFDGLCSNFLQKHFALLQPSVRIDRLIQDWFIDFPEPNYVIMNQRRFRAADFTKINLEKVHAKSLATMQSVLESGIAEEPSDWIDRQDFFEENVRRIQRRGGEVVSVFFPESGMRWKYHETKWPKKMFWDHFAKKTAAKSIHFKDVASLRNFECPDWCHLDFRDAEAFTVRLGEELLRLGVIND